MDKISENHTKIKGILNAIRAIHIKIPSFYTDAVRYYNKYLDSLDLLEYYVDEENLEGIRILFDVCDEYLLQTIGNSADDGITDALDTLRSLLYRINKLL